MTKSNPRKGFTLIELLVVIAVIGILASVILVGLSGARARGRDARRLGDIKQVQNGLELYFSANGKYPATSDWATFSNELKSGGTGGSLGISTVPDDPDTTRHYGYCAISTNRYIVGATLEQQDPTLSSTYLGNECAPTGITCGAASKGFCASI